MLVDTSCRPISRHTFKIILSFSSFATQIDKTKLSVFCIFSLKHSSHCHCKKNLHSSHTCSTVFRIVANYLLCDVHVYARPFTQIKFQFYKINVGTLFHTEAWPMGLHFCI